MQAFDGTNTQVPVWFMRQAGRYLPAYRKLKGDHSLEELFKRPELAAQVTLLPVDILGVDGAILFADILTLPALMGVKIVFDNDTGPKIEQPKDLLKLKDVTGAGYVEKTCALCRKSLAKDKALIGFAGSPFTVLTYLTEGRSNPNLNRTLQFILEDEARYHRWMDKLTRHTIFYLKAQLKAGADCFQLFDTWAGMLRASDYARWVLPYVKDIFKEIDAPSIYYVKNCSHLLALMDKTDADFLSVCHTVVLGHTHALAHTSKGIQGNLYNGLLYADEVTLRREVHDVLLGAAKHDKYIFNLSHGVFPDTRVETLKAIVEQVHRFPWNK
jgi:uroporphyrinogen decarboxylase